MMDAWQAMDDWCRDQGRRLQDRANPHVEKGGSLDDPEYRRLLGQSQAFLKMRSFIHGHRGADDALRDDAEPTAAMIEAGVEALEDTSPDTSEAFVTMIFKAMISARSGG